MRQSLNRTLVFAVSLGLVFMCSGSALAQYTVTLLDSNVSGHGQLDPLLVNGWGLAYLPNAAFWVADAGSGWSTLYDGHGNKQSLQVVVPSANGLAGGSPTGIVANSSHEFQVKGSPSEFIFATLDGTISGWAPLANPTQAIIAVNNNSSGASYTGLAITNHATGNMIYAADTANFKIDMYDANFALVKSFTDPSLPNNATPFGIQDINGTVLVAYCDANGGPGGVIDEFTEDGVFIKHFASGAPLNQPWGLAVAPKDFGPLSNTLLVSNNLNVVGDVNGFDLKTGKFVGTITGANGKPIHIDQIWGIEFGGGSSLNGQTNQLFWAAGPLNNVDGAFGYIAPQ